jgi:rRNA-processing protein FCF1
MGILLLDTCAAIEFCYLPNVLFNSKIPRGSSNSHTLCLNQVVFDELSKWTQSDRNKYSSQVAQLELLEPKSYSANHAVITEKEESLERTLKDTGMQIQWGEKRLIPIAHANDWTFVTSDGTAFE